MHLISLLMHRNGETAYETKDSGIKPELMFPNYTSTYGLQITMTFEA